MESAANPRQSISILVVEDEDAVRELLGAILSKKMPEVVIYSADNGRSGLESFKLHSPDITITDIAMPLMDGIRMAAEMKSLKPETVIVAVTAYTDTRDLLEAIEIGIDHYLLKPISLEKLFVLIDKVVASKIENSNRKRFEEALRLSEERHQNELRLTNNMLEQRVRERTADLESALRDQESFSYSISHDLRAPLRHINSFSAILIEDYGADLPSEARGYLDRVCAASNTMGKLIDHLLELSQMGRTEIKLEAVNLSEMAVQVLGTYQEADSQRCLEAKVAEGAVVWGDRVMLGLLLDNLLGNAWKYTSKKPTARIEFGRAQVRGEEAFFVRDDGAGFDMAYQQRLFCAFERLHGTEFEGVGIGLATSQRIIKRHGGNIWAEGKVDEGATFYFTLPVYY